MVERLDVGPPSVGGVAAVGGCRWGRARCRAALLGRVRGRCPARARTLWGSDLCPRRTTITIWGTTAPQTQCSKCAGAPGRLGAPARRTPSARMRFSSGGAPLCPIQETHLLSSEMATHSSNPTYGTYIPDCAAGISGSRIIGVPNGDRPSPCSSPLSRGPERARTEGPPAPGC